MKKIFLAIFVIGIIFCNQLANFEKAEAKDIYVGSQNFVDSGVYYEIDYYIDPNRFSKVLKELRLDDYSNGFSGPVFGVYRSHKNFVRSFWINFVYYYPGKWDYNWKELKSSIAQNIFNVVYPTLENKEAALEAQLERERRAAEEKRRREEEEKRRVEAEKERNFNNLIAESDKFYIAKNYDGARNSYKKARAFHKNFFS